MTACDDSLLFSLLPFSLLSLASLTFLYIFRHSLVSAFTFYFCTHRVHAILRRTEEVEWFSTKSFFVFMFYV